MDKMIEQLKELKNLKPRAEWVEKNRDLLLAQISAQAPAEAKVSGFSYLHLLKMSLPTRFVNFVAKPMGIVSLVLLFVAGSGALTVNAARESLPGSILYPVKLTSEQVAVGLTVSEKKKTELRVSLAEERVREIEKIMATAGDSQFKQQMLNMAADSLKKEMTNVTASLDKVKNDKTDQASNLALIKQVDTKVGELATRLDNSASENPEASKILSSAKDAVDAVSVKAVEVIVDKYDKGQTEISSQEIKDTMEKQVKKIEDRIANITDKEKTVAADVVAPIVAPSTDNDKVENPVVTTPAVTPEPVANSADIKKSLDEAIKLLNAGDMVAALEKMKESQSLSSQMEDVLEAKIKEIEASKSVSDSPVAPIQ